MKKLIFTIVFFWTLGLSAQSHRDSIDVIHYNLEIDLTQMSNHNISGCATINFVALQEIQNINFDLFFLITDSVFINNQQIDFSQNDTLLTINYSVNEINQAQTVKIYYHGNPQQDSQWGGFYFSGNYAYNMGVGMGDYPHGVGRYWYPCIDSFTDRATYEYHIKTPESFKAVCGGVFQYVSNDSNDGKPIYYWKCDQTIPTYLSSVAVGPYIEISDVYEGINRDIPISIFVAESQTSGANAVFQNLKNTLESFETRFGEYKWDRVGYVVVPFNGGAMEHAMNTAFPQGSLTSGLSDQNLAAHELAHSWFGNLVTCNRSEEMWLNEGWASYCEAIFKQDVFGLATAKQHVKANHIYVLKSAHIADGDYYALNNIPHHITYGKTVYDKGADVVHSLRGYLGDELFFSGVKDYLSQNAFSHASSVDLMNAIATSTGEDLTGFFNNWVNQPGFPHYTADSFTVNESGEQYAVSVSFIQKLKFRDSFSNKNRVPVTFMDNQWNRYDTVLQFDGQSAIVEVTLPFEPKSIFTDLDHNLNDASIHTNYVIHQTGYQLFEDCEFKLNTTAISDSVLVNVIHNWVLPSPMTNELPGVTISNLHYWKIEGIENPNFQADGKFSYAYSKNTNPDDNYTIGATDTLIMLYRKNAAHNWVAFAKGPKASLPVGDFYIENIRFGEYAIAYWDGETELDFVSASQSYMPSLEIFPNPFKNKVNINLEHAFTGLINIYDLSGKVQISKNVTKAKKITIKTGHLPKGVYLVKVGNSEINNILVKE